MEQEEPAENEKSRLTWHAAFVGALQAELKDYADVLEFDSEHHLTAESLRIDCIVIKKNKNTVIKKNIAAIFRKWNILEYKNPGDYRACCKTRLVLHRLLQFFALWAAKLHFYRLLLQN